MRTGKVVPYGANMGGGIRANIDTCKNGHVVDCFGADTLDTSKLLTGIISQEPMLKLFLRFDILINQQLS